MTRLSVGTLVLVLLSVDALAADSNDELARLRAEWARWQTTIKKTPFELHARLENGKTVRVRNAKSWPNGTETSYALQRDKANRIRVLVITPTSQSGDWSFEVTYLFDEEGRTVVYQKYFGTFDPGCEVEGIDGGKETRTEFIGAKGNVLAEDVRSVDFHGVALADKGCVVHMPDWNPRRFNLKQVLLAEKVHL